MLLVNSSYPNLSDLRFEMSNYFKKLQTQLDKRELYLSEQLELTYKDKETELMDNCSISKFPDSPIEIYPGTYSLESVRKISELTWGVNIKCDDTQLKMELDNISDSKDNKSRFSDFEINTFLSSTTNIPNCNNRKLWL